MPAFQTYPIHGGTVAGIAHMISIRINVRLRHRLHLLQALHGE